MFDFNILFNGNTYYPNGRALMLNLQTYIVILQTKRGNLELQLPGNPMQHFMLSMFVVRI